MRDRWLDADECIICGSMDVEETSNPGILHCCDCNSYFSAIDMESVEDDRRDKFDEDE